MAALTPDWRRWPGGTTLPSRAALARLWWRVKFESSCLGWRGLAGLALLAAAAVLWLGAQRPDQRRVHELRADVAEMRVRLRSAGPAGTPADAGRTIPRASRAEQLATFHEFFPSVASLPDWLAVLNTAASRNGLLLENGEYALVAPQAGERLARYEMSLPVKGTWPQLRGFVADLLDRIPAAALQDVTIERESVGAPRVEAKLVVVVWLGTDRNGAASVPLTGGDR